MYVQPYLQFDGRCEEALEFYKKAAGIEVTAMIRFDQAPDKSMVSKGSENKVMHAAFKLGDTVILASDGHNKGNPKFDGFNLTIQCDDAAQAKKMFDTLGRGGTPIVPLLETFFAKSFGMFQDKFGVHWIVIAGSKA